MKIGGATMGDSYWKDFSTSMCSTNCFCYPENTTRIILSLSVILLYDVRQEHEEFPKRHSPITRIRGHSTIAMCGDE